MATATTITFALVTYKMVASIETDGVQFANTKASGFAITAAAGASQDLQSIRGLEAIIVGATPPFKGRLDGKRSTSRRTSKPLPTWTSTWHGAAHDSKWTALRDSRAIFSTQSSRTASESFALHTRQLKTRHRAHHARGRYVESHAKS